MSAALSQGGRAVTGAVPWLAVLLALAGSAAFAVAAVTQQGAAARLKAGRAFDPAVLARLARRPAWLAGLAAVIAGFALQAVALALGRLVVIEPVLASGLLFALVLAARRERRPLSRAEWAAARAGGGVAAGATDALTKSVAVLAAGHLLASFADARLYLLIVVGLLAFTIQQNGYRAAALAAFLPAFAVIEPVSGSLAGLVIYHERLNAGPAQVVVELTACAAAAWGIAHLAGLVTARGAGPGTPVMASETPSA